MKTPKSSDQTFKLCFFFFNIKNLLETAYLELTSAFQYFHPLFYFILSFYCILSIYHLQLIFYISKIFVQIFFF